MEQEFTYPRQHIDKQKQVIKSLTEKLDACLKHKVRLQSQIKERDSGIIVNGWKIEETKHLSAGFLTWRARNLQTGNEYIGKTKKECIVWCENLTLKTK